MSPGVHARHPFTPQRSPPIPSSQASQSSPSSEGGEAEFPLHAVSGVSRGVAIGKEGTSRDSNRSIDNPKFNRWTYHQSLDQIIILFYVPSWAKEQDLQITFGSNYLIAGLRQSREKVIQAQLAGQIDPQKSNWQLEKLSKKRRRGHNRGSPRQFDTNSRSDSHSSDGSEGGVGAEGKGIEKHLFKTIQCRKEDGAFGTVSPASVGSNETSSFDMVFQSVDTLNSEQRRDTQAINEEPVSSSSQLVSPQSRLDQSMTLSEESGYVSPGEIQRSIEGAGGVLSLESSISFDPSQKSSSSGRTRSDELDNSLPDAKLVTLLLSKVPEENWQEIVNGPASLSILMTSDPEQVERNAVTDISNHQSLTTAVSEALDQANSIGSSIEGDVEDRDINASQDREGESDSFTQSTTTINTISSDDSTTVLGFCGSAIDEEQYEMDATSLVLMGIKHTKQGSSSPFPSSVSREESRAFEYFKRSWRKAEVPMATRRLVESYIPPQQGNTIESSPRKRMIASLGGPTALARLYVSYARLHLHSHEELPLKFPFRIVCNTFVSVEEEVASSQPQFGSSIDIEPIILLREAYNLDKNVAISQAEWEEAHMMESNNRLQNFGSSKEEESQADESDQESHTSQKQRDFQTTIKRRKGARTSKLKRKSNHRRDKLSSADPGLYYLVGSTALLSVVVAGGVAMAGWWRRTAAAGGGN